MEIASESVHQLLAFVDGVSRQGHPLSAVDFESYERSPRRTVHRFGRFAVTIGMLAGGPAESQLEWLDRVGWLQKNAGTVMITDLGRAVLRSLDEAANVPEGPLDVILDANEPTSYATVVGKIAGVGDALLVDPYCRLEQLWDIARHTSVDRVLTSAAIGKEGVARCLRRRQWKSAQTFLRDGPGEASHSNGNCPSPAWFRSMVRARLRDMLMARRCT